MEILRYILLTISVFNIYIEKTHCFYCTPKNRNCWPNSETWQRLLGDRLDGKLHKFAPSILEKCSDISSSDSLSKAADGACMQIPDCSKRFCLANETSNLPSYSVEAKTTQDVIYAIQFANKFNIAITVKTTGHSFSGSSFGRDTLLIWMRNFQKFGQISNDFCDSCGKVHPASIKMGGGQTWREIYGRLAGTDYNILGALANVISSSGGWLMGAGLSPMSPNHGLGIDNVLRFDVVLPNGCLVIADACKNTDLFWALRGGGGGTFGVVVSTQYKLLLKNPFVFLIFNIVPGTPIEVVDSFIDLWVMKSPHLDQRWGGYWNATPGTFIFEGSMEDADKTFLNDLRKWKNSIKPKYHQNIIIQVQDGLDGISSASLALDGFWGFDSTAVSALTKNSGSWFVSRKWVVNDEKRARKFLKDIARSGKLVLSYILGGEVSRVGKYETSVSPHIRDALWEMQTFDDGILQFIRKTVPDSGSCYNHGSKTEPDWRRAFWGDNLERLESLKRKYDPSNRLNCWHCIGYQGSEI
ncbi:uncharacterized protein [Clytia hemisphaerica]|uniref:FAD-binding PCMH-type domain-containing protein n=1 Tax=Clytia hemisphaerica TaxID=252671 RepID=A0A7M6DMG0_9CNID